MLSLSISNISILNIQGVDYCCNKICKTEAMNLLQNVDLTDI